MNMRFHPCVISISNGLWNKAEMINQIRHLIHNEMVMKNEIFFLIFFENFVFFFLFWRNSHCFFLIDELNHLVAKYLITTHLLLQSLYSTTTPAIPLSYIYGV